MMTIRSATYHDAPAIKSLLQGLGYPSTVSLLVDQLEMLFGTADHQVFVYEYNKEVIGFVSVHFLPQLAAAGGIALISYLSVDESVKEKSVATALEDYVAQQARKRKCERIQVHCQDWRAWDHHFYKQQGYTEYPKYYTRNLAYNDFTA